MILIREIPRSTRVGILKSSYMLQRAAQDLKSVNSYNKADTILEYQLFSFLISIDFFFFPSPCFISGHKALFLIPEFMHSLKTHFPNFPTCLLIVLDFPLSEEPSVTLERCEKSIFVKGTRLTCYKTCVFRTKKDAPVPKKFKGELRNSGVWNTSFLKSEIVSLICGKVCLKAFELTMSNMG